MNASRLIASVGGYFASAGDDTIALHLYGGIATTVPLAAGKVTVREESTYPWSGAIRITVTPERPTAFALRIPGWTRGTAAAVNGAPSTSPPAPTPATSPFPAPGAPATKSPSTPPCPPSASTPTRRSRPTPAAWRFAGGRSSIAWRRPTTPAQRCSGSACLATAGSRLSDTPISSAEIVTLTADACCVGDADWIGTLYRPARPEQVPARLVALPYYLWNNRGGGSMTVWIPEIG